MVADEQVTRSSVSPDSGTDWAQAGVSEVVPGVFRIPLPLASDGLRAVNVYAVLDSDRITMIDGGWAIAGARNALADALAAIGFAIGDISRFLVTHSHRDHYTLASLIAGETCAEIALGLMEKPTLDFIHDPKRMTNAAFTPTFTESGAADIARQWEELESELPDPAHWRSPDRWLVGGEQVGLADRVLGVRHTPGHTPGHVVFVESAERIMFSGDHLLPSITPSLGFVVPTPVDPLRDFLASLQAMRDLGDMTLLPAHGPIGRSSAERAQELLDHHGVRLGQVLESMVSRSSTSLAMAERLRWTRRELSFDDLDAFNQGLAVIEARAHLNYLVGAGVLESRLVEDRSEYLLMK